MRRSSPLIDREHPAATAAPLRGASLRPIYATAGVLALVEACYAFAGARPSPAVSLGSTVVFAFAWLLWLRRDAVARHVWLVHDWGFLAASFWPVFLPWYAFATRGRRGGLGLVARIVAAFVAPPLIGAVLAGLRAGGGR